MTSSSLPAGTVNVREVVVCPSAKRPKKFVTAGAKSALALPPERYA